MKKTKSIDLTGGDMSNLMRVTVTTGNKALEKGITVYIKTSDSHLRTAYDKSHHGQLWSYSGIFIDIDDYETVHS